MCMLDIDICLWRDFFAVCLSNANACVFMPNSVRVYTYIYIHIYICACVYVNVYTYLYTMYF